MIGFFAYFLLGLPLVSCLVDGLLWPWVEKLVHPGAVTSMVMVQFLAAGAAGVLSLYLIPRGLSPDQTSDAKPPRIWWEIGGLALIVLLAANNASWRSVHWEVGAHRFFDELGLDAASVERLWQGDLFFRDVFMMYGFLIYWPVYALMKIFGHQLMVLTVWTWALDTACLLLLYIIIKFLTGRVAWSMAGAAACLFLFYPEIPYPHAAYSRYMLGFVPALFTAYGLRRGRFAWTALGLTAAVAYFFYNYDYGLAAGCSFLLAWAIVVKRARSWLAWAVLWSLPIGIFCMWLASLWGGLGGAWEFLSYYPRKYHEVGVWEEFPDIWRESWRALSRPGGGTIRNFILAHLAAWPFLVYGLTAMALWKGSLSGEGREKRFLALYLCLFAWACAPKYIFRTGFSLTGTQLYLAPAVVLAVWWASSLWGRGGDVRARRLWALWFVGGVAGYLYCHVNGSLLQRLMTNPLLPRGAYWEKQAPLQAVNARGLWAPEAWQPLIDRVAGGPVKGASTLYVYPQDSIWYFLLNMKNPTYSDIGGNYFPRGWERIRHDLEKNPPDVILESNLSEKPMPPASFAAWFEPFVQKNYIAAGQNPNDWVRLWRRNPTMKGSP